MSQSYTYNVERYNADKDEWEQVDSYTVPNEARRRIVRRKQEEPTAMFRMVKEAAE